MMLGNNVMSKSCLIKGLLNTRLVCSAIISCWQSLVMISLDLVWEQLTDTNLSAIGGCGTPLQEMHLIAGILYVVLTMFFAKSCRFAIY